MSIRSASLDKGMGTYTRPRHCVNGHKTITVELESSDLNELRRLAFLYNLAKARGQV